MQVYKYKKILFCLRLALLVFFAFFCTEAGLRTTGWAAKEVFELAEGDYPCKGKGCGCDSAWKCRYFCCCKKDDAQPQSSGSCCSSGKEAGSCCSQQKKESCCGSCDKQSRTEESASCCAVDGKEAPLKKTASCCEDCEEGGTCCEDCDPQAASEKKEQGRCVLTDKEQGSCCAESTEQKKAEQVQFMIRGFACSDFQEAALVIGNIVLLPPLWAQKDAYFVETLSSQDLIAAPGLQGSSYYREIDKIPIV